MNRAASLATARQLVRDIDIDAAQDERLLNLCANDNVLSNTALHFLRSPLSFRYRVGTFDPHATPLPDKHGLLLRGFGRVDALERAAHGACAAMFGGVAADLRPLSGVHATLSIILAVTRPGDTVYSIAPADGGHFATRALAEQSGRTCRYLAWDARAHALDLDGIARQFAADPPTFILLDHSAPLLPLDTRALRRLAGPQALIDFDASHSMGLVAGGLFQSPLHEGCDMLHGNTHKSFPGPQKALMVFADHALARRVQDGLSAGLVSSLHTHHLIALCVTLLEMQQWGRDYAAQMVANAAVLRDALLEYGFALEDPAGAPAASHIVMATARDADEGLRWFEALREAGIATNVRPLFGRTTMRLGVQEATRRGFVERDMSEIAGLIHDTLRGSPAQARNAAARIAQLRATSTGVRFSFDDAPAREQAPRPMIEERSHAVC